MLCAEETARSPIFDVRPERFLQDLHQAAAEYFPRVFSQPVHVETVKHSKRHHSELLQLHATDGRVSREVVYKIPFSLEREETQCSLEEDRPRLYPESEQITNGLREFWALKSIEDHFRPLNDPRFDVISVFKLMDAPKVVVMEKSDHPELKSMLKKATRFHRPSRSAQLPIAMENAGAWLREFHTIAPLEHTEPRHLTRQEFVETCSRLIESLTLLRGRTPCFQNLQQQLTQLAQRHLPEQIPCAVLHGDFAARNLLISSDNSVTGFDTQRRWYAPLYEDIAYFLNGLKVSGPQVQSCGLIFSRRQLQQWEDAFLRGYFPSETRPVGRIRLYECLLALEWWGAVIYRNQQRSLRQRLRTGLTNGFLTRHISRLLSECR